MIHTQLLFLEPNNMFTKEVFYCCGLWTMIIKYVTVVEIIAKDVPLSIGKKPQPEGGFIFILRSHFNYSF